jgi:DDE superfamily endonuclease
LINLIDVLAIGPRPASPVEMTLSPLWGYRWSSLYTGIDRASQELAETIADDDWLQELRKERLAWLASQEIIPVNPAIGKWRVRILDATDYPRPKTETVKLGYVHGASGMRLGHGLSLLSERVGEGSWTLPLEIDWIPPKSNPITYGVAQLDEFVKRHGWLPQQVLTVDAQYTVEPFLNPVHQLGIPILGRVASNRVFFLPPPPYPGFGRPRVRGRKIKLNDARTLPKIDAKQEWELEDGRTIEVSRWDDIRTRKWPGQRLALYRVIEYKADGKLRYKRPLWLIFVPASLEIELPTPCEAQAIYDERFSVEICQTQPIKMTWSPLRLLRLAINSPRGRFKRENEVDVNIFSGDDDFLDQALRNSLTLFKRELFEIVAEQFAKCLGVVNDLAPVNSLLSSARQLSNLLLDLLRLGGEFLSPRLHLGKVDGFGLIGVEQPLILSFDSLSALEQL